MSRLISTLLALRHRLERGRAMNDMIWKGGVSSIRLRLILWLLLPMTLLGLGSTLITSSLITTQANQVYDRLLLGVAHSIEQRIARREGEAVLNMPYFTLDVMESASQEKVFYRVEQQSGSLLAGFKGLPVPEDIWLLPQESGFYDTLFAGNELRAVFLKIPGSNPKTSVVIVVAETLVGRQAFTGNIVNLLTVISLLTVSLMLITAAIAVHQGLLPLRRLSRQIKRRSEHDLRPVHGELPRELQPLADSINVLIRRTRENIEHIQQFNADVSHQLRTPLAELKTLSELAQREARQSQSEDECEKGEAERGEHLNDRFRQIEQIVDFMSRTTQQLLSYAKTRQSLLDQQMLKPLDLSDLCRDRVARQVPRVYRAGGELEFDDATQGQVWVEGDAVMLTGLLINLIDNALFYGHREGEGARILIALRPEGSSLCLSVVDRGPGIDPERIDRVTERFVRLDQQRQGSGLGLAIVQQICEFHQATLKLDNLTDEAGVTLGLRVRVFFPLLNKGSGDTRLNAG